MSLPSVKLHHGIHVMHLFYRLDHGRWDALPPEQSADALGRLEKLCAGLSAASHPRLCTYAPIGGKADMGFILYAAGLDELARMHRDLEACFPRGILTTVYSYLSVTELSEYMSSEEDTKKRLLAEKLEPGTPTWDQRWAEAQKMRAEYEHYRLQPELPDWEIMCFYPMNKRRVGTDNWYSLDFDTRKRLMGGHARVGRKYAGRVTQMITGSAGLDDWEWGVTLVAHQLDSIKEIVYEMRFDEVTARFGEFGAFYISLRVSPTSLWAHLGL